MARVSPNDVHELAEHLHDCWPLLLNDGLQLEIAQECATFLEDRSDD